MTSNTSRITEAMYGMIMIARITPDAQDTDTDRRTLKQRTDDRDAAEQHAERLFEPLGEDRREDQQTPHAVDDRRDRGEQLDGDTSGRRSQAGASSVRNSAMPKLTGTAITSAMIEVAIVP